MKMIVLVNVQLSKEADSPYTSFWDIGLKFIFKPLPSYKLPVIQVNLKIIYKWVQDYDPKTQSESDPA